MVAQNLTKTILSPFRTAALVLTASLLAFAADRPRDDTKVSIEPRIKPAAAHRSVHDQYGRRPESAHVYAVQGKNRAAGRNLHGDEQYEEGAQPPQGHSDYFRWRRQQQPLHRERNQKRRVRSRRAGLCD